MEGRRIIHIDMDAFYAAVEQRDEPGLRGLPIAVGGGGGRGVVMTASYEARPFGVRSAMPTARARRLCPDLVVVRPRFEAYRAASRQIHAVFARYTALVEPLSLDEAYLDVTAAARAGGGAVGIARAIKADILAATGLTASAGVSFAKFLAKLASELRKPDGLAVIRPDQALAFIAGLPVAKLHGVGPATARRLHGLGIHTGADLQAQDEATLARHLGAFGGQLHRLARGRDDRPVRAERRRKSLSVETTFERDLLGGAALAAALEPLAAELAVRLARSGFKGHSLVLKLKFADFRLLTRRTTRARAFDEAADMLGAARGLLARCDARGPVRLLGLGVASERDAAGAGQLDLGLHG